MPASAAPESILRDELDRARAENAALQDRVRALEESVRTLKRSVFLLATDPARVDHQASLPLSSEVDAVAGVAGVASVPTVPTVDASGPGGSGPDGTGAGASATQMGTVPVEVSQASGAATGLALASSKTTSGVGVGAATSVVGTATTAGSLLTGTARQIGGSDAHSAGSKFVPFVERVGLKGHAGAVYALRFSPDGACLVSASFDRSVRVWPIDTHLSSENATPSLNICDAHRAPVVAVEWLHHVGGHRLVTGGFDASAAEWDVDAALTTPVARVHTRGLVNAVSVSAGQPHVFFAGTARCAVHMFDRRARTRQNGYVPPAAVPPSSGSASSSSVAHMSAPPTFPMSAAARGIYDETSIVVDNDAPVNSIHVESDGLRILTGDHAGAIKTWDLRMVTSRAEAATGSGVFKSKPAALVDTTFNDPEHRPITHVHTALPTLGDDGFGRWLAVNSYGSYLRVYDRGAFQMNRTKSASLRPLHALRGVVNRNWPIKSSFFVGQGYRPNRSRRVRPLPPQHRRGNASLARSSSGKSFRSKIASGGGDTFGGHGESGNGGLSADGTPAASMDMLDVPGLKTSEPSGANVQSSSDELDSDGERAGGFDSSSTSDDDDEHIVQRGVAPLRGKGEVYRPGEMPVQSAVMLASGSANGNIYMFDIGGGPGTGTAVQVIRGHRDRVHSVEFHPTEPILASASADSVVKIWS